MRIVIQPRTASNKLPGKSLLPVRGWPLVALAARRAARSGYEVILATSSDPSDEALASLITSIGIPVIRGPENDVFARFLMATAGMNDDDIVIRFTGDNVVPDADFAQLLLSSALESDAEIVGTKWPESELPYGVFGEAIRVRALRQASSHPLSDFERLHVSPWIWRNCKHVVLKNLAVAPEGHKFKCAVSNFVDYQHIVSLFENVADPIAVTWDELVRQIARLPEASMRAETKPVRGRDTSAPLVLGTAQLGMPYGIAGQNVMPSERDSVRMVNRALELGVAAIDTARAYQLSEERVGLAVSECSTAGVTIITKLDPLSFVPADAPQWALRSAVGMSVFASCRALRLQQIPVLLLHRGFHRNEWSGTLWRHLLEFRNSGVIGKLGVSVQNPSEAISALQDPDVEHIQLPMNILDDRWSKFGAVPKMLDRTDVTIHARSIFLQGLLVQTTAQKWPRKAGAEGEAVLQWLGKLARDFKRKDITDLLIAYVRSLHWIDGLVIGHDSIEQLETNAAYFQEPVLTQAQIDTVHETRPAISDWLLDPAQW